MRLVCCCFLLLVGVATPSLGRAAGAKTVDADPDTEIARRHFERGGALYNEGKYTEAIVEFQAAKNVKPLPAFDFNIARCHDRLEHVADAIAGYEHYLGEIPTTAIDAGEVRARVAVLKQRLATSTPIGATPPIATPMNAAAAPAPPEPALILPPATTAPASVVIAPGSSESLPLSKRHRRYTWIIGGAGVALLVGSLAAGLVANSRYGNLSSSCATDGTCDGTKVPDAQSWIDSGKSAGLASDVLLGVGAAAVITGVALFFVEGKHPPQRQAWRIAPTFNANGAGLTFAVSP